ncbi:hypothetical protein RFN25_30680 [Mesorhizobium abyssinicae]|uniref:hypothetical protein n=1 Tax=Mesorhizobium abyssinicae TaxID=1209958 RepID=UPI002A23B576|nr:hypothetical protein [Mesorhizobium abyssinicae]MDX8437771.1 hypothetical protein [Mesorhizobium abyssinicae]
MTIDWTIAIVGCAGGAVPDVLRLIKARHEGAPEYLKHRFFWIMFFVLVVGGGACAVLSGARDFQSALALGFGAPEILSRLASSSSSDRGDAGGSAISMIRSWWRL